MQTLFSSRRLLMQGGVSQTTDTEASNYLGVVLVDEASGKVVIQQEQHANTHSFMAITWDVDTSLKSRCGPSMQLARGHNSGNNRDNTQACCAICCMPMALR